MKVTKERLKAFTLKVEEAAKECFGVMGIVLDSEGVWVDTEEVKSRYPDLPRDFVVIHSGFECDLIIKKEEE